MESEAREDNLVRSGQDIGMKEIDFKMLIEKITRLKNNRFELQLLWEELECRILYYKLKVKRAQKRVEIRKQIQGQISLGEEERVFNEVARITEGSFGELALLQLRG